MASRILQALARKFIGRADGLGYRGKKRDDAALDFFCGAAVAPDAAERGDLSQHIHTVNALVIATRGYVAVRELAAEEPAHV